MKLCEILVHLDQSSRAQARLDIAASLARQHGAHLTALQVIDVAIPVMAMADGGGGGAVIAELMEQMRQAALAAGVKLKAAFEAALARKGIMGEWRQVEGTTPENLALHGRYADLLVLGQDDPESDSAGLLETVLFDSGRPVLAIPFAGNFKSIGKRVLIGWNASREATRALHDALPLIAKADTATVFLANPKRGLGAHGEEPGADIARHLVRHGLKVEVAKAVADDVADSALLLNHASDMGADLLVMGAYGHSRLREFILGGVTRSLLREMTIPVLLSH
ncbi:MAG: universal stress protein [Roseomonas sp.]|nr:universal stress protein [Roseomonas sp.]MCA3297960.1 universal stress protein [Roseomonas sp.]